MEKTPTPWHIESGKLAPELKNIIVADKAMIAIVYGHPGLQSANENTAFIVEACNNYEQLKAQATRLREENEGLKAQVAVLVQTESGEPNPCGYCGGMGFIVTPPSNDNVTCRHCKGSGERVQTESQEELIQKFVADFENIDVTNDQLMAKWTVTRK